MNTPLSQRPTHTRCLAVLALLVALVWPQALRATPAPTPEKAGPPLARVAESPSSPGKPAPQRPEREPDKKEGPVYAAYLKDPASLGFKPDARLFETVYAQVKLRHFENDPDPKLFAGVAKETERLLKEAGLSAAPLASIPRSRSMPEAIAQAYAGKIDRGVLFYAMIRGMLESTDDPYTVLMTPREYHRLMEQMQSESFGGIGIFIELDRDHGNQVTIVEPVEGTPAHQAGLQPGDQVVKIDGKSTAGMSLDVVTSHVRGPEGTKVVLTIRRPGTADRDYTITRAKVQMASVSHRMLPSRIGFIKLRVYGARTGAEMTDAIRKLEAEGARALIIDVRNNGGGYVNAAIDVCSNFVPQGSLVTYVTDRNRSRDDYNARSRNPKTALPVVLLTNGYSASASEITAGCLKDYTSAILVGTKTFGKGSVQQLYPLPDGGALKLTIAHFFTPKGHAINKVGVQPDIVVEMDPRLVGRAEKDVQLQKAIETLRSRGVVQ